MYGVLTKGKVVLVVWNLFFFFSFPSFSFVSNLIVLDFILFVFKQKKNLRSAFTISCIPQTCRNYIQYPITN